MRILSLFVYLVLFIPIAASAAPAQETADQARFAKLLPLVGEYSCSDTGGGKPYRASVRVEGGWVVWREKNDDPSTEFTRWDASLQSYVNVEVESRGGLAISTTKSSDPLNASWNHEFPPTTRIKDFRTSFSNGVFGVAVKYVLNDGTSRVGGLTCRKLK